MSLMSAQSVTLDRTSFSAMVGQVVPCLVSPHKAKGGLQSWWVGLWLGQLSSLIPLIPSASATEVPVPPHVPEFPLGRRHNDCKEW